MELTLKCVALNSFFAPVLKMKFSRPHFGHSSSVVGVMTRPRDRLVEIPTIDVASSSNDSAVK